MTRYGRLVLFFAVLATIVDLGVMPMTWSPSQALFVWAGSIAIAVLVARGVDAALWRRDARYERWREQW